MLALRDKFEIKGADASRLAQYITPRDIKKCEVGQAMYAPLLDFDGGFINDPVMLKIAEDHYWFSLSDSDATFMGARNSNWSEL